MRVYEKVVLICFTAFCAVVAAYFWFFPAVVIAAAIPSGQQGIPSVPMTAIGSNQIAKAADGNLFGFLGFTTTATGCFYVFNATSLPANGAVTFGNAANNVPVVPIPAQANTAVSFTSSTPAGVYLSVGITIGFSSTCGTTFTASTTALISSQTQ